MTPFALLVVLAAAAQQPAASRPAARPPLPEIHVQTGHVRVFKTLDVSADGRLAATSADGLTGDGTVKIWDLATGLQIRTISLRGGDIRRVALSPDHRLVAVNQRNDRVTVVDVTTGRPVSTFESGWFEPFTFTDDGRGLLAGMTLWNPRTGVVLLDVRPESATRPPFEMWRAEVSRDGRLLAARSEKGEMRFLRADTGRRMRLPDGARAPFAVSADGALLAGRTTAGAVGVWRIATGRQVMASAPTSAVPARFGSGDRELMLIDEPRRAPAVVIVLDVADGRELRRLEIGAQFDCANCSVSVSPDGKWVMRGGWGEPRLSIWNLDRPADPPRAWRDLTLAEFTRGDRVTASFDGNRIWSIDLNSGAEACAAPAFGLGLLSVVSSTSPGWLATGDLGGGIVAWDVKTGIPAPIPEAQAAQTPSLSFLASGTEPYMVREGLTWVAGIRGEESGRGQPSVPRVDWMTPACAAAPKQPEDTSPRRGPWDSAPLDGVRGGSAYPVAFSPGGGWVISNIEDHPWIHVANARTRERMGTLDAAPGEERGVVTALAARRNGAEFASATTVDSIIGVWNPKTWQRERSLRGHEERVTAMAYDDVTGQLASASWDKTVRLWDTAREREIAKWRVDGAPSSIAFSPDGRRLVAVMDNQILELRRGSAVRRVFAGQTVQAAAVSYSPDGRLLVAANVDGSATVWNAASGKLLATLISFAHGQEWLVVTPEGYFDGSPSAWRQILWRFNRNAFDVVPVETYYREFYRQGLLTEIFSGAPLPRARLDAIDRRQPQVTVSTTATGTDRLARIRVDVREAPGGRPGQRGSGVRDVRLFRNGSLIHVWHGDIPLDAGGRKPLILENVPVVAGENRFSAYAFSRADIKSQDHEIVVTGAPALARKGIVWILAIGINRYLDANLKLDVAAPDAEAFAAGLYDAQKRLGRYEPRVIPLLDDGATKENLLLAFDVLAGKRLPPADGVESLRALQRAQPEDAVVVFFAGHGKAIGERFYLIPRNVRFLGDDLSPDQLREMVAGSISDRDLSTSLEQIDAHDMLLVIDACRSGQALHAADPRQGPLNAPGLPQLAYEKGMYILTAAQAYQDAIEGPQIKDRRSHGLLTQALLDNLGSNAQGTALRQWLDAAAAGVPVLYRETFRARQEPIVEERVQRPRVFYRRIPERTAWIVAPGSGS